MTTRATKVREQSPNETRNHAIDFSPKLETAELLTGTPTVTISPSGPTLSNKQVNGSTVTINGNTCIAGKAVLFTASGLTLGENYTITATCESNSTPVETLEGTLDLRCRA